MPNSTNKIQGLWQRIERVLEAYAPETMRTLAPPATDHDIAELEKSIKLTLPTDLRDSLKVHNGQNDPTRCHSICGEGIFLNAAEIAERWRMNTEIDEAESRRSPAVPGRGPWWKRSCIPFTDAEGNMLCIDMDATLGNRVGEIICHVHDSEIERGLGDSLEEWLSSLAARLEAGRFRIDKYGYLRLDTEVTPN
jgi:cell wall assembly regulator SMI1